MSYLGLAIFTYGLVCSLPLPSRLTWLHFSSLPWEYLLVMLLSQPWGTVIPSIKVTANLKQISFLQGPVEGRSGRRREGSCCLRVCNRCLRDVANDRSISPFDQRLFCMMNDGRIRFCTMLTLRVVLTTSATTTSARSTWWCWSWGQWLYIWS